MIGSEYKVLITFLQQLEFFIKVKMTVACLNPLLCSDTWVHQSEIGYISDHLVWLVVIKCHHMLLYNIMMNMK